MGIGRIATKNSENAKKGFRDRSSRRDLVKVAQREVLGSHFKKASRPGLSAIVRMPPPLFELRRARNLKAAPKRSDGGTKEERDDRRPLTCVSLMRDTGSQTFLSSLAGRTSPFAPFPSPPRRMLGYFHWPLRDQRAIIAAISVFFPGFLQG
jgi:hypothetical protein